VPAYEITVEGVPVAQPRPQVTLTPPKFARFQAAWGSSGGSLKAFYGKLRGLFIGRAYVPEKHAVHAWRRRIAASVRGVLWDVVLTEPVRVEAVFLMPRTQELNRKQPDGGRVWYAKKTRDIDNLLKAVLDAVNDSKVWTDDGLVVDVVAQRFYAGANEAPGLRLRISPAGDPNEPSGNQSPAQS
jgi:Holliday junction resolvase RusA-like endonuclease